MTRLGMAMTVLILTTSVYVLYISELFTFEQCVLIFLMSLIASAYMIVDNVSEIMSSTKYRLISLEVDISAIRRQLVKENEDEENEN